MKINDDQNGSGQTLALPLAFSVLGAAVCFLRIRHTYFIFDDFLNFALFQERGSNFFSYILLGVFGQLAPGYRLAQAVVYEVFGPNNVATIAIISLMSGLAVGLAVSICQILNRDIWVQSLLGVFFVFSYQQLDAQLWWASSLHAFPGLIAALAMIRLLLSNGRYSEIWAAVALAFGLSFYSKTLFSVIFALGILMSLDDTGGIRVRLTAAVWRMRFVFVVAALYPVLVLIFGPRMGHTHATVASVAFFLWQSFADASLAATLGLGRHGSKVLGALSLVPGIIVLTLIVVSSLRLNGKRVLFVWMGFAGYFLASMTAVGYARSGHFPESGLWPRYSIENVYFLLICVALAFGRQRVPNGVPRILTVSAGLMAAVYLQVQSSRHIFHAADYEAIKNYVENLRKSLAQLPAKAVIADADVPEFVQGRWIAPFNRLKLFVPIYSRHEVASRDKANVEVRSDGSIRSIPLP